MTKITKICLLLCSAICAFAQLPYTTVTGTLLNVDGQTNFNGTITVSWPDHDVRGVSNHVAAGSMQVAVFNGAISMSLVPTDKWYNIAGGGDAKYTVVYTSQGTPVITYWVVPTSSGSVTVTSVSVSTGGSSGTSTVTQWGGINAASSAGAASSPYSHTVSAQATGNTGTTFAYVNHWNDIAWVQVGQNYAIRQTGLIKSVKFSFGNPGPNGNMYTHLYFILCRPSPSNASWNQIPGDCPVVAKSEDLLASANAQAGGVVSYTFNTPIYARKGDYYGFESQGTFNSSTSGHADDRFFYETANCGSTSHCYIMTTVTNTTIQPLTNAWNIAWSTNSSSTGIGTDNAIPVQINMATAPVFVMLGDSIFSGATRNAQLFSNVSGSGGGNIQYDPTSDIGWHIKEATGWTYQNLGIPGQRTDQIFARVQDAINANPKFILLEGGVNDIAQSVAVATAESNWTTVLTTIKAAGITPVCMLVLPWTNGNSTQNGNVDTLNAWLNGQCEQYGGFTVDARSYVGQFRTGGATDNLWNIRPEYMSVGDNLQIHFSTLGYQAIAKAILDRMGITTGQATVRKSAQYYLKAQSQSTSLSATNMNCNNDSVWFPTICESGLYRLSIYMSPMTTAAASTVSATVTFKDTGTPGNAGNLYTLTTSSLDLSAATNNLMYQQVIVLDGLTEPTIATTYSGTATYQIYASLERID